MKDAKVVRADYWDARTMQTVDIEGSPQVVSSKLKDAIEGKYTFEAAGTQTAGTTVNPVQRLTELIKNAKPVRVQTETLKHQVKQQQAAQLGAIYSKNQGEAGLRMAKGALKGELPVATFTPPRSGLSVDDINALYDTIAQSPKLRPFEVMNTQEALNTLLGGQLPTVGQIGLLENIFGPDLAKALLKMRPWQAKFGEALLDILNIPRTLVTSFDISAPMRQGFWLQFGQPKQAFGAYPTMMRTLLSWGDKHAAEVDDILRRGKYFDLSQTHGVYHAPVAERGLSAGALGREEAVVSKLVQKIPGVKQSANAYVTYLNKLRQDVWANWMENAAKEGKVLTDSELDTLAKFLNYATGRGDLGRLQNVGSWLNVTFFSPRFQASRFELPLTLLKGDSYTRKIIAKNLVAGVGAGTMALTLAWLGGARVELDPRSADWGKIRIGDTRIDFWAGEQQWARLIALMILEERKTNTKYGPAYTKPSRDQLVVDFVSGKFAPATRMAWNTLFQGKTIAGDFADQNQLGTTGQAQQVLAPMFINDVLQAVDDLGLAKGMISLPSAVGVGVQTYEESLYSQKKAVVNHIAQQMYGKKFIDLTPDEQDKLYRSSAYRKNTNIVTLNEKIKKLEAGTPTQTTVLTPQPTPTVTPPPGWSQEAWDAMSPQGQQEYLNNLKK